MSDDRGRFRVGLCVLLVVSAALSGGCGAAGDYGGDEEEGATGVYERPLGIESPKDAWRLLREGNERFAEGATLRKDVSAANREDLAERQQPFAVVIACSDSRVAPELLFDQGLGDLFVVRVAGNVVDPVALGSVEYAVDHLDVPLVVVLGHEECGAVTASCEGGKPKGSIAAVVAMLSPSVTAAKKSGVPESGLVEAAADRNISRQLAAVKGSPIVVKLLREKKLEVIGAKYMLDSGEVEWLE